MADTSALDNLFRETSSASSLLKYELIGSQSLSAHFLHGEVSSVRITSVSRATDVQDFSNVDESSFQTVSDHVWVTSSNDQSSGSFNAYAEYVAQGAYALVGVAAV